MKLLAGSRKLLAESTVPSVIIAYETVPLWCNTGGCCAPDFGKAGRVDLDSLNRIEDETPWICLRPGHCESRQCRRRKMMMHENCLLSREPVYDGKVGVAAYELHTHLFGGNSASTLFGAFNDSGLDSIVGEHSAIISLTSEALSKDLWKPIPSSRTVLGFFEDFAPSDPVTQKLSYLDGLLKITGPNLLAP